MAGRPESWSVCAELYGASCEKDLIDLQRSPARQVERGGAERECLQHIVKLGRGTFQRNLAGTYTKVWSKKKGREEDSSHAIRGDFVYKKDCAVANQSHPLPVMQLQNCLVRQRLS